MSHAGVPRARPVTRARVPARSRKERRAPDRVSFKWTDPLELVGRLLHHINVPQYDLWSGVPIEHVRSIVEKQSTEAILLYKELFK